MGAAAEQARAAAPGKECAPCHARIVASYARTGMARSFQRIGDTARVEDFARGNRLEHAASNSVFTMQARDGRYFVNRHQPGPAGSTALTMEKEIEWVIGSGRHARGYAGRGASGALMAMPVSWYVEQGGYWHMAPGYDRAGHPHFRRRVGEDCLFCHNGYPRPDGALAEGIDCARCHGDPSAHLRGGAMPHPKRLPPERQLDLCMQCHLETTSQALPASILRFGRERFSYRAGEPLADYAVHFDHEGFDAKFEVVSSAYRLRRSACFVHSRGRLVCTTCHDPHAPAGVNDRACASCHAATKPHGGASSCSGCHMAKRRPDDAPRTTITDHWIARRPGAAPHRPAPEEYRGRVVPYLPADPGPLYVAMANARRDPATLRKLLERVRPREYEPWAALCDTGDGAACEAAIARAPGVADPWRRLALLRFPLVDPAPEAIARFPADPFFLVLRGEWARRAGRLAEARLDLERAIELDPDHVEARVNLGAVLGQQGNAAAADVQFRQALAIDPDNAVAKANRKRAGR